jgi:hypothetical protein
MCIITRGSVVSTSIVVAPLPNGRHFTLYENTVELPKKTSNFSLPMEDSPQPANKEEGASMILPFPGKDCEMYDFPNVAVFERFKAAFPLEVSKPDCFGAERTLDTLTCSANLEVKQCGSYQYSVAPTIDDLERLDKGTFFLDNETISYVKGTYTAEGWGFLVCKLIPGKEKRHIAYTYTPATKDETVFVPTRHYHGRFERHPHWDHRIYAINALLPWFPFKATSSKASDAAIGGEARIAWIHKGFPIDLGPIHYISVLRIDGRAENQDLQAVLPKRGREAGVKWLTERKEEDQTMQQNPWWRPQAQFTTIKQQIGPLFPAPMPLSGDPASPPRFGPPRLAMPFFANDGEEVVPLFYTKNEQGLIAPSTFASKKYMDALLSALQGAPQEAEPSSERRGVAFSFGAK